MTTIPPLAAEMMTLCALSATAPNPRPSGETVAEQEQRILLGIIKQLGMLGSHWAPQWLILTQDRANLAYIATQDSTASCAVVLRGTQFNSLVDLAEDMQVSTLAQFTAGGDSSTPLLIAKGTMEAFTEIINSVTAGTTLLGQLQAWNDALPEDSTPNLYVTGHSLGGCMATTLALYLNAQSWRFQPVFGVYTFAAPTAGLQPFADYYDATFPDNSYRIYNAADVIPNAWASLNNVYETFFPSPGPGQSLIVHNLLKQIEGSTDGNVYVQTNDGASTIVLSGNTYDPNAVCATTSDFFLQLATQHANNTYLTLLGAETVPPLVPSVSGITPNNGAPDGDTAVTITGTNFSSDCVVDFGTVPATGVQVISSSEITATAPLLYGTVDVLVTNFAGTSPATPADEFTAPPPATGPTVTAFNGQTSALTPNGGPAAGGTTVTISGTGFVTGSTVQFGETPGTDVRIVSLTRLTVVTPAGTAGTPVDVTVTNPSGLGTSPTSSADQFTYGLPVITSLVPDCGPATPAPVTISGQGFDANCTVTFNSKPAATTFVSTTQLLAIPEKVVVAAGLSESVDVIVTNPDSNTTSPVTRSSVYTFCQPVKGTGGAE
jgi:hypothetical protein